MKSLYSVYANVFEENTLQRYIIPPSVEIDLTNGCNQDCTYCNVHDFRRDFPDQTKIHEYHQLIERLASWKIRKQDSSGELQTVTFVGGGEPTLRKGFEFVIEHCVSTGLKCSLVTNGILLNRLLNIKEESIRKISWIGLDIDSGLPEIYEKVRRTKKEDNTFERVKRNAKSIIEAGANLDIKCLLMPETASSESIEASYKFAHEIGARTVYWRLCLMKEGKMYTPSLRVKEDIKKNADKFKMPFRLNTSRLVNRKYKKCYALYLLPIFAADGKIYLCCENRGNSFFKLSDWREDFREEWCGDKHSEIFNKLNLKYCKPCRPHVHNVEIDNLLRNKEQIVSDLFF